jgi:hypothetical protein
MDVLLAVLLWLGIVLGGLLLVVLLVPVHVRAWGRVDDESADGRVRVRWGGGIVSFHASPAGLELRVLGLRVSRLRGAGAAGRRPKRKREEHEEEGGGRGPGWAWRHRRALLRAVSRLLAALHPRGRVSGVLGLGDPADMAALFALLSQAQQRWRRLELDVACDWTEEVIDLEGAVRAVVWPVELAIVLLVVRLRPDVRRALRADA